MVPSPALQAAAAALLQLQQSKPSLNTPKQTTTMFKDELTKQLINQSINPQSTSMIASAIRPAVFIPLASDMGFRATTAPTTSKRDKKNKSTNEQTQHITSRGGK